MAALQAAIALHQQGQWREAEAAYRSVLLGKPRDADALALLGAVLSEQKKHDEAVRSIEAALRIDAQAPLFHFYLGNAYEKAGKHDKAAAAFTSATAIAPGWTEGWYNLANAQRAQNKDEAAKKTYERVLKLDPTHALAHNNLGMLLNKQGDNTNARKQLEAGLTHHPLNVSLLLNLSDIALEQNDLPTAFNNARKAAHIKLGIPANDTGYLREPGFFRNRDEESTNCLIMLAACLLLEGKFQEAGACIRALLAEEPNREEALSNLGMLALGRNELDMADECFAQSFMLDPTNSSAPWNRSMVLLTKGDMRAGFRLYHWRWHALKVFKSTLQLPAPKWIGEDLKGKTFLLHEEQGFGDTLQMLRFIPWLRARGVKKLYVYARPPMFALLQGWDAIDELVSWDLKSKAVPEDVDYVCSVMDLLDLLDVNLTNIPAKTPYLPNPLAGNPAYRLEGAKPKIGVVWQGNPKHKRDHERSVPFASFGNLFEGVDADFYSFQYAPSDDDKKRMAALGITDLHPRIKNLADTAAFLSQLDLLITIDSAPAHLAGGLGVPVWVLVTHNPDWRWLLNREDSPWYPTVRVFRQPRLGDWGATLSAVKAALPAQIAAKPR